MRATRQGWPFFAPSADTAIEVALDLAGIRAGERFVDLGCGDGTVLLAAARRGASVTGVECDRELAHLARDTLADRGVPGTVLEGDLFAVDTVDLAADVVFAYLSPVTLQRLTPVLARLGRARLVTVDFPVPDLVADEEWQAARLYRLPGRARPPMPDRTGWAAAGTLCVMPPEVVSLTCLELVHPGGPVTLQSTGGLRRHASVAHGADRASPGGAVAVDIRWRERPPGTLAVGTLVDPAAGPHPVTVLFDDDDQGQWDLSRDAVATLAARLRRHSLPRPTTTAELLAVVTGG